MRCQFCGWDNPEGKETCEKCNKPLVSKETVVRQPENPKPNAMDRPTDRKVDGIFNPKATVREFSSDSRPVNECPDCGYPMENGECSACGYRENTNKPESEKVIDEVRKTLRPVRKGSQACGFKLVPLSEETGLPEGDELVYEGKIQILNRDNTDPANSTITSQEQARLIFNEGKWSIEDKSEYRTTFVQASRNIELQPGDLILLGNQLYRFEI